MTDPKLIERSFKAGLAQLMQAHGIGEAVVIVTIQAPHKSFYISCNYLAPPGINMPTPLQEIKANADAILIKRESERLKIQKPN